jgi:hypothetical protein
MHWYAEKTVRKKERERNYRKTYRKGRERLKRRDKSELGKKQKRTEVS